MSPSATDRPQFLRGVHSVLNYLNDKIAFSYCAVKHLWLPPSTQWSGAKGGPRRPEDGDGCHGETCQSRPAMRIRAACVSGALRWCRKMLGGEMRPSERSG